DAGDAGTTGLDWLDAAGNVTAHRDTVVGYPQLARLSNDRVLLVGDNGQPPEPDLPPIGVNDVYLIRYAPDGTREAVRQITCLGSWAYAHHFATIASDACGRILVPVYANSSPLEIGAPAPVDEYNKIVAY